MNDLWGTLLPLALAGALVPIQIVVTVLLLRSPGGVRVGAAFVAGMTAVRLVQGVVFGLILSGADEAQQATGPGTVASAILVVLAILLYVTAARSALGGDDPEAPPPRWMAMTDSMTGAKAFAFGAGFIAVAPKFWVFTLSAIAAIEAADLSAGGAAGAFLGFVVVTQSVVLTLVAMTALLPRRSTTLLEALAGWLERRNRALVVLLGLAFGTWFLLKGLGGLGVI